MKTILLFLTLLFLSVLAKAQTVDTVDEKVQKISDRDFEIAPRFKDQSIYRYIDSTISYPKKLTSSITDYAVVKIFVDTDGIIKDAKLLRTISPDIDREILKAISKIHKLKPAIYNSQIITLNLVLDVIVRIDVTTHTIKTTTFKYNPIADTENIDKQIFVKVEKSASFPGGPQAFRQYLGDNIVYPINARKNNIQGKVVITFVVEKDGSLSTLEVLSSPDDELSIEALRVLRASPKFDPGIQNGKPVRIQFTMPISFSLNR